MEHRPNNPEENQTEQSNNDQYGAYVGEAAGETAGHDPERDLDITELTDLLFAFEQRVSRDGWDQPARVFTLNHLPDDVVGVTPLLTSPPGIHPATLMEITAAALRSGEDRPPLADVLSAGYFGLALAFEAWERSGDAGAATDPSRPFADQVGSVECRLLHLRTVEGRELLIRRVRGQEPQLLPHVMLGRLPDALTDFMDAINEALLDPEP